MSQGIPMPLSCEFGGRTWHLYSIDYKTADGAFSTYIYAISFEHAAAILEELRETARLGGQVMQVVGGDK